MNKMKYFSLRKNYYTAVSRIRLMGSFKKNKHKDPKIGDIIRGMSESGRINLKRKK